MNRALAYWNRALLFVVVLLSELVDYFKNFSVTLSHFTTSEQVIFIKRLAMMLRSGMPIVAVLEMLDSQSHTLVSKRITKSLVTDVAKGQTLSFAMQKFPKSFGVFCINMVRVGESSGTLPLNLEYVTVELKKKQELRKQIVGALVYPAIIVIATLGITFFLILYIFPKILPIFSSLHIDLPLSTRIVIEVSELLKSYWHILLGSIALCVVVYPQLCKNNTFKYARDSALLKIPIFGRLHVSYNLTNVLRTLGLLLQHEVWIVEALTIASLSSDNLVYKEVLIDAQKGVVQGQLLSARLQKHTRLFPPLCIQMIKASELTGNLGPTLEYISEIYEADMRDATKNLTTVLEPILMLTMGLCVGFIAVSIITPIYGITQNLHQ